MYWKIASAGCLLLATVLLMLDRPGLPDSAHTDWAVSDVRVVDVEQVPAHTEQVRRPRFSPLTVSVPAQSKITLSIVGYRDPTAQPAFAGKELVLKVPASDPQFQDIAPGQQWVACHASTKHVPPLQQVYQLARTRQQLRPCQ